MRGAPPKAQGTKCGSAKVRVFPGAVTSFQTEVGNIRARDGAGPGNRGGGKASTAGLRNWDSVPGPLESHGRFYAEEGAWVLSRV